MLDRFSKLPASLAEKARTVRLKPGDIPALLCHPDWISPVPTVIWMHGRTANKELDSGRYSRWIKAGIAAVAVDLPGHGERVGSGVPPRSAWRSEDTTRSVVVPDAGAAGTLDVLAQMIREIDLIVEALADPVWQGVFDLDRMGIGGMSLGGMAALRRLCEPPRHEFKCAAVECTTGDLWSLYRPEGPRPWGQTFSRERVEPLDPLTHLDGFRPIPLLALHCEADRIVPWGIQKLFLERLREHYLSRGADPQWVEWQTWPETGAPEEHSGFGRFGNEAKNAQTEFLVRRLLGR